MAINDQLALIIKSLDAINKTNTSKYGLSIEDRVYTISEQLKVLSESGFGNIPIHICSSGEYDQSTGLPIIENPEENVFYLVPNNSSASPDLFIEYVYVNNNWEIFGNGGIIVSIDANHITFNNSENYANGTIGKKVKEIDKNVLDASGGISRNDEKVTHSENWTIGNLNRQTGKHEDSSSGRSAYSELLYYPKDLYDKVVIIIPVDYRGYIYCYDADQNYIYDRIPFTHSGVYSLNDGTCYIRISETPIKTTTTFDIDVVKNTGLKYITEYTESRDSALGNMIDVAKTYFDRGYINHDFIYKSGSHGIYGPNVTVTDTTDPDYGKYTTICNAFVNSCLKGTSFDKSRYTNSDNVNHESDWAWVTDGTGEYEYIAEEYPYAYDYLTSNKLAKYADSHGWLHPVDNTYLRNNIRPGDVIFSGNSRDDLYKSIDHCAIVTNVKHYTNSSGKKIFGINVMEAHSQATDRTGTYNTGVRFNYVDNSNSSTIGDWTYYATMPVYNSEYDVKVSHIPVDISLSIGGANSIINKDNSHTMLPAGMYTFKVTGSFSGNNDSFCINVTPNGETTAITYHMCMSEDGAEITIYMDTDFSWELARYNGETSECYVKSIDIYNGAVPHLIQPITYPTTT